MAHTTFTTDEAMKIRERLRDELGLGEETLSTTDLVRMIGDEMKKMGDDHKVAKIIEDETGKSVDPADLSRDPG